MSQSPHVDEPPTHGATEDEHGSGNWWTSIPLYLRILAGLILGVAVGLAIQLTSEPDQAKQIAHWFEEPSRLILRLLSALAPPLILVAIIHALMTAELRGSRVARLGSLLVLNTLVAIIVGLFVANLVQPGKFTQLSAPPPKSAPFKSEDPDEQKVLDTNFKYGYKSLREGQKDMFGQFLENIPDSLLRPFIDNTKTIGVIFVAVAFGLALRAHRRSRVETLGDLVEIAFAILLSILHVVIQLVPIGVFGIVASIVAKEGFGPFIALGAFVLAVLLALAIQACYYLIRIRLLSWVRPIDLIRGTRDALVMAFSTASSTATMPLTYECLYRRVKLREESASMGALVGANFNNDGTALYEAMSALFIAQMTGKVLGPWQQVMVVITSVVASVGAAGIPEAGLVTMTLVFNAVGLDPVYIPLLLTVDWFLDRCRTAINVMGDCNVSCILDGRTPESAVSA